jgi:hypothetical protein
MAKIVRNVPIVMAMLEGSGRAVDRTLRGFETVPIQMMSFHRHAVRGLIHSFGGQLGGQLGWASDAAAA